MATILIIEDENEIRSGLKRILELSDFDVLIAANGLEGVAIAKKTLPDIILCDIMMPELDGHQVLDTLKQDATTAAIPFIFLTAKSNRSDIREGMDLGADDYLTKPVKSKDLLTCIHARINKKKLQLQQSQTQLTNLSNNIARSIPHELNTPLNGILGLAEVLTTMADPMVQELSQEIVASGERLQKTISKFLIYTELVELSIHPSMQSRFEQQVSDHAVSPIITDISEHIATQYQRQSDLQLQLQPVTITASVRFFKKLLEELIENAFKFSKPGDPVSIHHQQDSQRLILTIQDQGRGMTPEQITAIGAYNQFERTVYEQQGIGLGLVIAKYIAELQGGSLAIASQPGLGTTLRVELPVTPTLTMEKQPVLTV